ncbi:hypothetical protein [Chryseosolibacter indicus]|uniref:Uncharacterized protein n=1 Tax=Chryseosolibacter indicus TaxID=2782351 RepID=A0ABS5VX46_9BACT|nr:hypothetical protein [Chryseosolibacter indicus]MBT1705821.1 hypothetical protein [Chryseosolibacter indicus]
MNYYLLIASIVAAVICLSHSVFGEIKIIRPIQKLDNLPIVLGSILATKQTLRLAWHVTSVLGLGSAAIFFYYSSEVNISPEGTFVLKTLSFTYFVAFLISLICSKAKHPSWAALVIVSILVWIGSSGG